MAFVFVCFFFFQAEDGIRDHCVTGVQTCALPISVRLVLNHPAWSFAESWTKRTDTNSERAITALGPELRGDLAQAREIMRQLRIEGEILWTTTRTDTNQFDFQVRRPGHYYFIKSDLVRNRVTLRHSTVNLWGVMKVLHVFSGVSMDDA